MYDSYTRDIAWRWWREYPLKNHLSHFLFWLQSDPYVVMQLPRLKQHSYTLQYTLVRSLKTI